MTGHIKHSIFQNKFKIIGIVLKAVCSMKSKIEAKTDFEDKCDNNPVQLLNAIKELATTSQDQ